MIIDAHCHVFPENIAEKASENTGKFYGKSPYGDGRLANILEYIDRLKIDHTMICSVATRPRQVSVANRFLSETRDSYPRIMSGIGTMHPDSDDQQRDLEELMSLGLKAVKLHPDIQQVPIDDERMLAIFELCSGRIPVLCHMGDKRFDYSNPARVKRVLEMFPKLMLVGAHMGGWTIWREAAEMLHGYDGMMVDTSSAISFMPPEEAVEIIRLYGTQRVMFGIDYPMWNPDFEIKAFSELPLSAQEREYVSHRNAIAIYGLDL